MLNFNFSFRFLEKLLTFDPFWGILGPQGTIWRYRWVQILKSLRFWFHHRIPHDESSLNTKFQLFISFLREDTHVYIYRGVIGPLVTWHQLSFHISWTIDSQTLFLMWFLSALNLLHNEKKLDYIWTNYFLAPLWRHRSYDVTAQMMHMWQHHFLSSTLPKP